VPDLQLPPPQQQQHPGQAPKRSVGPPRSPGPPRRPFSPVKAAAADGSQVVQPAGAVVLPVQQQLTSQPPAQEEQQRRQQQQQQPGASLPHPSVGPPGTPRGPQRTLSVPPDGLHTPTASGTPAAADPTAATDAAAHQVQVQVPGTSSSSSSSTAAGPEGRGPFSRSVSANGPYMPRGHPPYPPHHPPARPEAELQQLHQQRQQQQQQVLPAWQLYFPLPEELGGPVRAQAVTAAAEGDAQLPPVPDQAASGAAADAAAAAGSESEDTAEGDSGAASGRRKGVGAKRDKALTGQKWQALVDSARRWHDGVLQEQQRQQQEAAGEFKQRT
jgi:hypothetical protein